VKYKILNKYRLPDGSIATDVKGVFNLKGAFKENLDIELSDIGHIFDKYKDLPNFTSLEIETDVYSMLLDLLGTNEDTPRDAMLTVSYIILRTPIFEYDQHCRDIGFGIHIDQAFRAAKEADIVMPRQFYTKLKGNYANDDLFGYIESRHPIKCKNVSDEDMEEFLENLTRLISGSSTLANVLGNLGIDMPSDN
jgi:hypothetical protein